LKTAEPDEIRPEEAEMCVEINRQESFREGLAKGSTVIEVGALKAEAAYMRGMGVRGWGSGCGEQKAEGGRQQAS
jgi:hypothetical protein